MRIVARLLVLLPLLWVALCASAYGAEQIDQITLERAGSNDSVDALRESDPNTLRARSGDTLVLRLAVSGPYEITIDKARRSSLGNTIIRGTTPSGGTSLMVIGADGSVRGHFERPDEVVQVSSDEDGVVTAWVEGVDAKMLPINDEVIIPTDDMPKDIAEPSIEELRDSAAPDASAALDAAVTFPQFKTGTATIRILIYYEAGFVAVGTVADYLVELTNTAFKDSEVFARLEIAALKSVSFDSPVLVGNVLKAMLRKESPFQDIEQGLDNGNADVAATLVYSMGSGETSAGVAYAGGKFSTERLSVTRYRGYQYGNSLYPAYTFAHEIGHNLGAKHNREQYENNGQDLTYIFSYAFGYLIENVQRSIMSYRSKAYGDETRIPRFSHPSISYNGYPTGISTTRSDSAFVARAFTNNRHVAAATNEFAYEQMTYESVLQTGYECGTYRAMRLMNGSGSVVSIESRNYVKPDGSIDSFEFSPPHQLEPDTSKSNGYCRPESEAHPLGTTYTQSFFRYYHPTTGELVEGPRFKWSETYIPQSEVRIAYTEGGKPIGNTVSMIPVGEQEDIVFEADRGFALDEIKSTCEGDTITNGFRVRATSDPCLLEASFSNVSSPPAAPSISSIEAGDGFAYVNVRTSDDGGADITAISAECTFDELVYSGESASSPVLISGLLNGRTYECSAKATNVNGTSPASAGVSTTLAQTMPLQPIISSTDSGDTELTLFVSESSQFTTVDSYIATCTDGTNTFTGTSTTSPITVSGLTNGVAYTCTVTATNSVGTSSASAATAPITPEEGSTGLPIWLLYQATQ
jgi:hypothetical protein